MREKLDSVESQAASLSSTVQKVSSAYCKELDEYMDLIDKTLSQHAVSDVPTQTVEEWILNITSILYFCISGLEEVGIREDLCKSIRQELYTKAHAKTVGTVAERQNEAALAVQEEDLILQIYSRAYKRLKQKVDAGYEMLNSMKKVLSTRITDSELSNSRYSGRKEES